MASKTLRLCLRLVLIGVLAAPPVFVARAADVVTPKDPIAQAEDSMLIWFDAEAKQETIVFGPVYRCRGDRFAWILPLPSDAKVEGAGRVVFDRLADYVAPRIEIERRRVWKPGSFLFNLAKGIFQKPDVAPPDEYVPPGKIAVLRQLAQVRLLTSGPDALDKLPEEIKKAFEAGDYQLPAEFIEWAKPYRERKSSWTMLLVQGETPSPGAEYEQVQPAPFRVTFATEQPFVPTAFRLSQTPEGWSKSRSIRYYVAAPERTDVLVGDQSFFAPNEVVFADRVSRNDWNAEILSPLQPEFVVTRDLFLTAFRRDEPHGKPVAGDGTFRPATVQATFRPPVQTKIEDMEQTIPLDAFALIGLGVVLLFFEKRKKAT